MTIKNLDARQRMLVVNSLRMAGDVYAQDADRMALQMPRLAEQFRWQRDQAYDIANKLEG